MKVRYNGIEFDSDLEVEYYKYLVEQGLKFTYHPNSIRINAKNVYTPDFIVDEGDKIVVVETKGYNQFSYARDSLIHNYMLAKSEKELQDYVVVNGFDKKPTIYKKIKYLKSAGWVDFDYKNPNSLSNNRKKKIDELVKENKKLYTEKKDLIRYVNYVLSKKKLTKSQIMWMQDFANKYREEQEKK